MNNQLLIPIIMLALFLSGCGTEDISKVETKNNETTQQAKPVKLEKTESPPSEVLQMETLISNYLLAFNSKDKNTFSIALTNVFQQEYIPHYVEEYDFHELKNVRDITYKNSNIDLENSKFTTDVTFIFIDGDGSPREYEQHIVANYKEFNGSNLLTFVYFYEDKEEVDDPHYTAYQTMTKNVPIAIYGGHTDLQQIVNPIGLNEKEEVEYSIFRQLIILYEAQYLEIDPQEYNRKANYIFHPDVVDDYLIQDMSQPINGNLNRLEVTTIEGERLTRTTENIQYKGYYNYAFYDVEGNEMRQTGEISAVFKQAEDGLKLISISMENY